MSGSGSIKGDCVIPFDDMRSIYVECKFTEKDRLSVKQEWLVKIQAEAVQMRCMFGILVVSFLRHANDYVLISPLGCGILDRYMAIEYPMIRATAYAGKSFPLIRDDMKPCRINTLHGTWYLTTLDVFRSYLSVVREA